MRTKLEILGSTGLEITADHFGANYLTHVDDVNGGKFADTLDELSIITRIRMYQSGDQMVL